MQRQPFVWTAINLYEEKKLVTGQITIDEFRPFRNIASDEYIFEQLAREIEVGKVFKFFYLNALFSFY